MNNQELKLWISNRFLTSFACSLAHYSSRGSFPYSSFAVVDCWKKGNTSLVLVYESTELKSVNDQDKLSAIWDIFGCSHIFLTERPIHSEQKWIQAIDIYRAIIEDSYLDPVKNGFRVGIEPKQTQYHEGRGIYATHPIKKGELVWSSKGTARFNNDDDYSQFLSMLSVEFVCEALQTMLLCTRCKQ